MNITGLISRTITVRESYDLSQLRFPRLWVTNAVQTGVLRLSLELNSSENQYFTYCFVSPSWTDDWSLMAPVILSLYMRSACVYPSSLIVLEDVSYWHLVHFLVWTHAPKSSRSCASSWSRISPIGWPSSWERKARNVLWNSTRSVRR
jgi:hypothetical protein